MPAILYGIGAFALFAGLVMIGFGIPINEFSFGNTLISAGTTAVVGGLILFGLGIVAGQLRRVAEALAAGQPAGLVQPNDAFENTDSSPAAPSQGRMAYPSRPRPEPHPAEPGAVSAASAGMPFDAKEAESLAPQHNPDRKRRRSRMRCAVPASKFGRGCATGRRAWGTRATVCGAGAWRRRIRHRGQKPRCWLAVCGAFDSRSRFSTRALVPQCQLRRYVAGRGEIAEGSCCRRAGGGRKAGCAVSRGIAPSAQTDRAGKTARGRDP